MFGTKIIAKKKSKFNGDIFVVKTLGLGTYIQVEGLAQSGGIVKSIWTRTIKKIKNYHKNVNSALILGYGGGTVGNLIKKYWPEAKIYGVDMDAEIVSLGKKYLNSSDINVEISDAYTSELVKNCYDLVIVDVYCGREFPKKFEYELFLKKLTKNKLVIINRLYFGEKRKEAQKFGEKIKKIFKNVDYYYPEANLMFICYNS